jgi:putative phage-type endonuclease
MNEQRSPAWYAARKGRVTGSEVGAILGYSPFQKAEDVMRRKVREWHGAEPEFTGNIATQWGTMHEPGALVEYEMETGRKVISTGFYEFEEWLGASPDGLVDNDGLIEVKCPFRLRNEENPDFRSAKDQMHYWAQMQIQMHVTHRAWCDFYQWAPNGTALERVPYAPGFIASAFPKLIAFWRQYLVERENPGDHIAAAILEITSPAASQLMAEYDDTCREIAEAEKRKRELIDRMVEMTGGADAKIAERSLTLVRKAGAISYAKAIKELAPNADLEKWRGQPSEYWVVK